MPLPALRISAIESPTKESAFVTVSIIPPDPESIVPAKPRLHNIVCVDCSGSMGAAALVQQGGDAVDVGFTVMDITKHAVKTILQCSDEQDYFTLLTFNENTYCLIDSVPMSADGKDRVANAIATITDGGGTDIYRALYESLQLATRNKDPNLATKVHLLTDGQHGGTDVTRDDIVPRIELCLSSLRTAAAVPPTIHTYGLGNCVDSDLLVDLAQLGFGAFTFIPDAGMVGTCVTHSIANQYAEYANHVRVNVTVPLPHRTVAVLGYPQETQTSIISTIRIGSVCVQQHRSVVLEVKYEKSLPISIETNVTLYENSGNAEVDEKHINRDVLITCSDMTLSQPMNPARHIAATKWDDVGPADFADIARLKFVDMLDYLVASDLRTTGLGAFVLEIERYIESVVAKTGAEHPFVADAKGEVKLAVDTRYYGTWGLHYLRSLLLANQQQRRNNFKDKSITLYGGELFEQYLDTANDTYSDMPPPMPSRAGQQDADTAMKAHGGFAAVYNNVDAGCLAPDCLVQLQGGAVKQARHIRQGDMVQTDFANPPSFAAVECVVEIMCRHQQICDLGDGTRLTMWHPVMPAPDPTRRGPDYDFESANPGGHAPPPMQWTFPCNLVPATPTDLLSVFSFVLQDQATALVSGRHMCIALGARVRDDPVASHDYFSTNRVLDDLRAIAHYDTGYLTFAHSPFMRDINSGCVTGMMPVLSTRIRGTEADSE